MTGWRNTPVAAMLTALPLRGVVAAAFAGAAAELAGVALLATATWLIVRAAAHPPIAVLGLAIVGVRAFALSRGTFRYVERLAGHDAALRALAALRERVFASLARLGPASEPRDGEALSEMVSDVDAVQDLLIRCLLPAVVAATVCGAMVVFTVVVLPAAAATVACGLLAATIAAPAMTYLLGRRCTARSAAARAALTTSTLDLVDGSAELAAYGARTAALARADASALRLARSRGDRARVEAVSAAAVLALQGATTLAVAVLAAGSVPGGLAPIAVPVLTLVCLTAFETAAPLPGAALHLVDAATAARRLGDRLAQEPGPVEPESPRPLPRGAVTAELTGARVRYRADRPAALDGIDLRVEPGRRIALVGPSGSGKSTVLAALARLVDVESGGYRLGGVDVRELATTELRARVTGAAQDAYVFHASIRENLSLARPDATERELVSAARRARLLDWIGTLPEGFDTAVGQDGATMSGGQRRRLVLARALLADPDVLLLDEPVEGLDPATADAVLAETLHATRGQAAVLVTHHLAGLDAVDEVVVLDAGRVVQRGTHAELAAVPGQYRELWRAEQLLNRHRAAGPAR